MLNKCVKYFCRCGSFLFTNKEIENYFIDNLNGKNNSYFHLLPTGMNYELINNEFVLCDNCFWLLGEIEWDCDCFPVVYHLKIWEEFINCLEFDHIY